MLDVRLYRHAESKANKVLGIVTGRAVKNKLSRRGEKQAHLLGQYLKREGVGFDYLFRSPTTRTKRTASIVQEYIGPPQYGVKVTPRLHENDQGQFTGKKKRAVYPHTLVQRINRSEGNWRPPGGESQNDVEKRMVKWLHEELEPLEGTVEDIGVFGHALAIKCLYRYLTDSRPRGDAWKYKLDNTGICRFIYEKGIWHVVEWNETPHLPKELVTNKGRFD